jgi:hypothetical protein
MNLWSPNPSYDLKIALLKEGRNTDEVSAMQECAAAVAR